MSPSPKSWRPLGTVTGVVGPTAGAWLADPYLGKTLAVIEAVIAAAVMVTAVYGSNCYSDRAFRLLCWALNRPEPPAPGG